MSQNVEIVSNLQLNFFDLKVRHRGAQSSIFVRTFRSFTKIPNKFDSRKFCSAFNCKTYSESTSMAGL